MRDIKFRAWNTKGIIYSGKTDIKFYIEAKSGKPYTINSYAGQESEIVLLDWVLMQYTGLKDKNGVEIYEGDVVRILYTDWLSQLDSSPELSHEEYLDSISSVKVVIWSVQGFYVSESVDGYASSMEHGIHGRITVIGNIYENPELLK